MRLRLVGSSNETNSKGDFYLPVSSISNTLSIPVFSRDYTNISIEVLIGGASWSANIQLKDEHQSISDVTYCTNVDHHHWLRPLLSVNGTLGKSVSTTFTSGLYGKASFVKNSLKLVYKLPHSIDQLMSDLSLFSAQQVMVRSSRTI